MDSGNFAVMYSQNTKTVKAICAMTPPPGVVSAMKATRVSGSATGSASLSPGVALTAGTGRNRKSSLISSPRRSYQSRDGRINPPWSPSLMARLSSSPR